MHADNILFFGSTALTWALAAVSEVQPRSHHRHPDLSVQLDQIFALIKCQTAVWSIHPFRLVRAARWQLAAQVSLPWLLARQPVHTHCEYSLGFSSPSTHPNSFPGSWGLPHGSAHVDLLSLTDPSQALVPSWCLFLPSYLICGDLAALVS